MLTPDGQQAPVRLRLTRGMRRIDTLEPRHDLDPGGHRNHKKDRQATAPRGAQSAPSNLQR